MRVFVGFEDVKGIEDFAITPYLFLVAPKLEKGTVLGLGVSWGYYGLFLAFGSNVPKGYPFYKNYTNDKK